MEEHPSLAWLVPSAKARCIEALLSRTSLPPRLQLSLFMYDTKQTSWARLFSFSLFFETRHHRCPKEMHACLMLLLVLLFSMLRGVLCCYSSNPRQKKTSMRARQAKKQWSIKYESRRFQTADGQLTINARVLTLLGNELKNANTSSPLDRASPCNPETAATG